jgi:protein SCO1/2
MPSPGDRPADISFKALLIAGSLCALALWWAWPGLQPHQKLYAEREAAQLFSFEPRDLPDFHLTGAQKPLTRASLKGQWTLIYFGYSRCADDCPATLGALAALYRQMAAAGHVRSLRFVIISVAADDDAQRIQDFAASFEASFEGYAGAREEREKLFLFFDAGVDLAPEKGPYQYHHATSLFLVNPEAHYVASWNRVPDRDTMHDEICGFINCPH